MSSDSYEEYTRGELVAEANVLKSTIQFLIRHMSASGKRGLAHFLKSEVLTHLTPAVGLGLQLEDGGSSRSMRARQTVEDLIRECGSQA